jgi:hypothetical protein
MPGWTYQRRTYRGRELRIARNPHSALLILSRDKLRYALRHIDVAYRGRFLVWEMDSAFAYYHSPFCLYRSYGDLAFHTVAHLDRWSPPPPRRSVLRESLRPFVPPIVLTLRRRMRG